ncbi:MAG: ethylbenzene dehydrogenase-related protein, partial [Actinomycetia bacterium]|nr:ethylbenzene dehydrogenase-related protein [Actinomycetes bacterium]
AAPTSTTVPAPMVSEATMAVISANCAGCHVQIPADHTGEEDSDQCGLCHIPYGQTTAIDHTELTEGCTECHKTPEDTHFYLRDEEDQTVLAADAEDRCITCHLEGGVSNVGRGAPALDTEEAVLVAAGNGTLRPWIQPGGFMAYYVSADEAAVITDWVDSISADRTISYDPNLDATRIDADLADADLLSSPAWDSAPMHSVSVIPTIFTSADQIDMKALYSNDYLYVWVQYADDTMSMTRAGSWLMDGDTWRHPAAASDNDKQSEDRVSIIWNISTPDFYEGYGCATKCHGNVPGSSEFTDLPGSTMDIWHSKAGRAVGVLSASDSGDLVVDAATEAYEVTAGELDFLGFVDDKLLIWYQDFEGGYDLEDSGRRGDEGESMYSHNRTSDKSGPAFIETAPESWADAMALTKEEVDAGEAIVADPTDGAYDAAAVAAAWEEYATLQAIVPERVLRIPEGSRGDVLHAATWKDGIWTNVFKRALVTGNPDDEQFDLASAMEFEFSVAVFDNCGRGEIPPGHTTYGDGQYQVLRFK